MKKHKITLSFLEFKSVDELNDDDRQLLLKAKEAAKNAYAPYSKFKVGAALRLANGMIVIGNNQENAVYPVGLCAERVALFSAQANYPDQPIVALAISAIGSDGKIMQPVPPCGSCRQAMIEAESRHKQPLRVIMQGEEGPIIISEKMENLMPLIFAEDFLAKYTDFE
ncbi:MAG: cytidine deaminase [Bacteroidales bacterium]|nr:cytidine deaminase [Bacteroidales bacterium]